MIYVNFTIPKTPRSFLKKLFSFNWNNTINSTVQTYYDINCKGIQCYTRKKRSFDDILECTQTYFPNITPKELFKLLLTLNIKTKNGKTASLFLTNCRSIRRIILIYNSDVYDLSYNILIKLCSFDSKYSWKDLFDMLNIKSQKDLDKFLYKYKKSYG